MVKNCRFDGTEMQEHATEKIIEYLCPKCNNYYYRKIKTKIQKCKKCGEPIESGCINYCMTCSSAIGEAF